ncbi:helix-turn-helix domain-containing protein [Dyella kyungheensis]|uniref:helix-turn-helix domain-containing protein n=1 Tax=Dyella kyungheensis TaxID=1242174 RepID=UPI003CF08912
MGTNVSGEVVKRLRLERSWTQEHLAHVAGINVRTVQRIEKSGVCDLETRASLASVFQVEQKQLEGEAKIEQTRPSDSCDLLYYSRVVTGRGIVDIFDGSHGYRFSHEDMRAEEDAQYIAELTDQINDYAEIWDDMDPGKKVKATYEFGEMFKEMSSRGFWLFGLRTRRKTQLPSRDGSCTPFEMKIANFHFAYSDSDGIIVLDPIR